MNTNKQLIESLACSEAFQKFERAFTSATGIPLTLRPIETWQLAFRGHRKENLFCKMMAGKSPTCAACLQSEAKLVRDAMDKPATRMCVFGLYETAVPVKLGPDSIGFLLTGQMMRHKASEDSFQLAIRQAAKCGVDINNAIVRRVYFKTPVISQKRLDAAIDLLEIFADHLSLKSNELVMRTAKNAEPQVIARARQFIYEHQQEVISLGRVSSVLHVSLSDLCRRFHKATGVPFTEFVSRTRVESAKKLLLNPNLQISQIAYATGFQSLSHFNRMFKRIMGKSPKEFRRNQPEAA